MKIQLATLALALGVGLVSLHAELAQAASCNVPPQTISGPTPIRCRNDIDPRTSGEGLGANNGASQRIEANLLRGSSATTQLYNINNQSLGAACAIRDTTPDGTLRRTFPTGCGAAAKVGLQVLP